MPDKMTAILDKLESLPTLPKAFHRIASMIENPRVSASHVSREIADDPALTAKLLKRINSAFYGLPRQVSTVTHAIVLLGFGTVKSLILAMSLTEIFPADEESAFDREKFWRHSQGVAFMSKTLARLAGMPHIEEIFVAGLLHDIGKIVLDHYAHNDLVEVMSLVLQKDMLMKDAESEVLGFTHAEIGAAVADRWNLPDLLKECITWHHQPESAKLVPEASIVHLADILIRAKEIGSGGDRKIPLISRKAWDSVGLSFDDIEQCLKVAELSFSGGEFWEKMIA